MIKCFGQADTSFSSNGDIVIQPFKALVHKIDNGDFYLELSPGLAKALLGLSGGLRFSQFASSHFPFALTDPQLV